MKLSENQYKHIMRLKKSAIGLSLFLFIMLWITDLTFGQGRNQEVTIIAPYQPSISDVTKIPFKPEFKDTLVKAPEMSYSINSQRIPTLFEAQPLKPAFIQIDPEKLLHRNYLKAGFGNYKMPYAEFYSNSLYSNKYSLGFYVRHLSSQGGIKDYPTSAFSKNNISVYGKRYLTDKVVSGNLLYDRDVVHYYGVKQNADNVTLTDNDLIQRFSLFGADVSLASNSRSKNNYLIALNFWGLNDIFKTKESQIGLKGAYSSGNKIINVAKEENLGANLHFDLYANNDSLNHLVTVKTALNPYFRLNFDYLDLTLGFETVLAADTNSKTYIYPQAKLFFKIIPDYLRLYLSVTGGLQRNTLKSTSRENPWINTLFSFNFTNTKYNFKGGVTGKINQLIDFNFSASYADIDNMLFFVNDNISPFNPNIKENFGNKFISVYDDVKVTTLNVEGNYDATKRLKTTLVATYRKYKLNNFDRPWHKPAIETSIISRYFLKPEIALTGELFWVGKSYARLQDADQNFAEKRINGYVDLNFGAEYFFNDKISSFAQISNITGTRYYRWYQYPSQRINVMAGVIFAF